MPYDCDAPTWERLRSAHPDSSRRADAADLERWHRRHLEFQWVDHTPLSREHHFTRLVALRPDDPELLVQRGLVRAERGKDKESDDDFARADKIRRLTWQNWFDRGDRHWESNRLQRAEADFSRAIALDAMRAAAWFERGLARAGQGRLAEGLADLRHGYPLARPRTPEGFLYAESLHYAALADLVGEGKEYPTACALQVQNPRFKADLFDCTQGAYTCTLGKANRADVDACLRTFDKLSQTANVEFRIPRQPLLRDTDTELLGPHLRGALLHRLGKHQEALLLLQEAAGKLDKFAAARNLFFLAMTQQGAGKTEEAKKSLKQAIDRADALKPTWDEKLELELLRKEAEELLKRVKP